MIMCADLIVMGVTRDRDICSGNIKDMYKATIQSCKSSNVLLLVKQSFDVTHQDCENFASVLEVPSILANSKTCLHKASIPS